MSKNPPGGTKLHPRHPPLYQKIRQLHPFCKKNLNIFSPNWRLSAIFSYFSRFFGVFARILALIFFKRCGAGVARPASDNGRFPLSREWGEGGNGGEGGMGEREEWRERGYGERGEWGGGMWEGGGCERQRMKRGIPPAKARIAQFPKNIKHSPFPRKRKSSNPPKHKLLPSENRPIPSNINYSPFPRKRESPDSRANGANYISHEESRKGGKRKVSGRGKCGG